METEFPFTLPRGYIDKLGQVHRQGIMRLAKASDEIEAVQESQVQANEAYLTVFLLSRVVSKLGTLSSIPPQVISDLYVIDLIYLENLYELINTPEPVIFNANCPECKSQFQIQVAPL